MLNKRRAISLLILALILALPTMFTPTTPALADEGEGSSWGEFLDENGQMQPGVIESGEVTLPADWMPTVPFLGDLEATYNVVTSPDGSTLLIPSATTLFFMAMNPVESGLTDSSGMLASGAGMQVAGAGYGLGGNYTPNLSGMIQALTGMTQVEADQFADAAISGRGNAWSLFNAFDQDNDVFSILQELARRSFDDSNLYLAAFIYESCTNSPTGCPQELCLANPAACGLPTPEPTDPNATPEPTPTEPPTCPGPHVQQAWPTITINPTSPNYPVAVGQDPDRRGVDVTGSVTLPPVVYTWYEPVYEDVEECRAYGGGTSNCTRANGQPGYLRTVPVLVDCIFRQEFLPEQITQITAQSQIRPASREWIENTLGAHWYGATVKQASINLNRYGSISMGCSGGTCTGNLIALEVPFADPGFHDLTITIGTAGTYYGGRMITAPRILTGTGEVGVWVILPTLIDANP